MAHYVCPDCDTRSDEVPSQPEADGHLRTHLRFFCSGRPGPLAGRRTGARQQEALASPAIDPTPSQQSPDGWPTRMLGRTGS